MQVVDSTSQTSERSHAEPRKDARTIFVVDDDDLSREVLALIAMEAEFEVTCFASGEEAIAALAVGAAPAVVLTDIQMPGIAGQALARQLRTLAGTKATLLAMSGSQVPAEELTGYDGFLLKPFSADELRATCDRTATQPAEAAPVETTILNESVFTHFARSMPPAQVFGLYRMCLDDSNRRVNQMRQAMEEDDDTAYRRAAHAIKGGCGMVGAVELAKLAAEMENKGLPAEHDVTPLDHFLAASARLGRMLDSKAAGNRADIATARP